MTISVKEELLLSNPQLLAWRKEKHEETVKRLTPKLGQRDYSLPIYLLNLNESTKFRTSEPLVKVNADYVIRDWMTEDLGLGFHEDTCYPYVLGRILLGTQETSEVFVENLYEFSLWVGYPQKTVQKCLMELCDMGLIDWGFVPANRLEEYRDEECHGKLHVLDAYRLNVIRIYYAICDYNTNLAVDRLIGRHISENMERKKQGLDVIPIDMKAIKDEAFYNESSKYENELSEYVWGDYLDETVPPLPRYFVCTPASNIPHPSEDV